GGREPVVGGRSLLVECRILFPPKRLAGEEGEALRLPALARRRAEADLRRLGVAAGEETGQRERAVPRRRLRIQRGDVLDGQRLGRGARSDLRLHLPVVAGGDLGDDLLLLTDLDPDGRVGGEGLDLGHVDGDLAGGIGLQDELAAGGADDLAREAVAVEEDDLIGKGRGRRQHEHCREGDAAPHDVLLASKVYGAESGGRGPPRRGASMGPRCQRDVAGGATTSCSSAIQTGDRARSMKRRSSSRRRRPAARPSGVAPAAASVSRLSNPRSATPSYSSGPPRPRRSPSLTGLVRVLPCT